MHAQECLIFKKIIVPSVPGSHRFPFISAQYDNLLADSWNILELRNPSANIKSALSFASVS